VTTSRAKYRWLLAVVVFCIFSFKIILVPVGEAGIRADDGLIVLSLAWLAGSGQLRGIKLSPAFKVYGAFLGVGAVSALWNAMQGRVNLGYSLVFVGRQAEYMSFFFFGYCLKDRAHQLSRALLVYTLILTVVVPAQMFSLIPVPGDFGAARASGNTNGPYELAAVAGFLLCYLGYSCRQKLSGWLALLFIVLSAARITFLGAALSLIRVWIRGSKRRRQVMVTLFVAAFAVLLAARQVKVTTEAAVPESTQLLLLSRYGGSSIPIDEIPQIYAAAPTYATSDEYGADMFMNSIALARDDSGDVSGMIRVYRWLTLIKTTLSSGDSIFFGLGPSFGTVSVDGYFVRVFVETGLLGVVFFALFLKELLSGTPQEQWPFREYVVILLVTSCFIDIFDSYKPMLLLWLWHGKNQQSPAIAVE
jgi:hypothetical protein